MGLNYKYLKTDGTDIDVYVNGVRLTPAEYTATSGTSIEDQLDMIFHMIDSGQQLLPGCTWHHTIKMVKESTPKPE